MGVTKEVVAAQKTFAAEEEARCAVIRSAFIEAYGVKRYEPRYMNYQRLFAQGGAGNEAVKRVLQGCFGASYQQMLNYTGNGNPFDHLEIWGRERTPLFLVGHPYNIRVAPDEPYISQEAAGTLDALRGLNLAVRLLGKQWSWYGYGTRHVVVYHWPTVLRVCGGSSPLYAEAEGGEA